jgi:hypothetical protein
MRFRLIEKVLREKILSSQYYQNIREYTLEKVLEEAGRVGEIGGRVRTRPHKFVILIQKLEQLNIPNNVVMDHIQQYREMRGDKYSLVLLLFYVRLQGSFEVVRLLKPFLNDYRKIIRVDDNNKTLTYVDEVVYELLHSKRYLGLFFQKL